MDAFTSTAGERFGRLTSSFAAVVREEVVVVVVVRDRWID
jgi:hypothetical protein